MFKDDLKLGNKIEIQFACLFATWKNNTTQIYSIEFNDNKEYDILIKMKESELTFEIKYDVKAKQTGNICIEYAGRNGVYSGITATKSDYYVFLVNREFIIFKTSELKKYCLSGNNKTASNTNAAFFLIKKEQLLKDVKNIILKI